MILSGPSLPERKSVREHLRSAWHFILVLTVSRRFAQKTKPDHSWHEGYAAATRQGFWTSMVGAFIGLAIAYLVAALFPGPPTIVAKGSQFLGAAFGFAGAVGIPKPESYNESLPAELANKAGVFILSLLAFSLGCYGVIVSP